MVSKCFEMNTPSNTIPALLILVDRLCFVDTKSTTAVAPLSSWYALERKEGPTQDTARSIEIGHNGTSRLWKANFLLELCLGVECREARCRGQRALPRLEASLLFTDVNAARPPADSPADRSGQGHCSFGGVALAGLMH